MERILSGDDLGLERVEPPADLAHRHVAGHEADVRVDGIKVPGARYVAGISIAGVVMVSPLAARTYHA